jgi:ATP-dependent RNA helicase DeaD
MTSPSPFENVPEALRAPLIERGFTQLTAVQNAVLQPTVTGRDLRISSQTGSGKTVAVGLLLAPHLTPAPPSADCTPGALIIAPTRELATQVGQELSWLLRGVKARVQTVVGGTSVREEQKGLRRGAEVVVATPGRLLDHLSHKVIDPSRVHTVVLDEADQMLDMGFREELEGILDLMPKPRRTHMMSATFPPGVLALARRYQDNALHVEGTRLGQANVDITHTLHAVPISQTTDAVINVLLSAPDEMTVVFVRTRNEASSLATKLATLGFNAAGLTGEMEQNARTRVMSAFRAGSIRVLVATDVAARGIDVPEVTRVIQADPPRDLETYTHRSGRTGRAGRKGHSLVIVPGNALGRIQRLLRQANIQATQSPVPDAAAIQQAWEARLMEELQGPAPEVKPDAWPTGLEELSARLLSTMDPQALVHRLLLRAGSSVPCKPRNITRSTIRDTSSAPYTASHEPGEKRPPRDRTVPEGGWVGFKLNLGSLKGMDARRLLAVVCRKGDISGKDVGAIKVGPHSCTFTVAGNVAQHFARAVERPDPREPTLKVFPVGDSAPRAPSTERPKTYTPRPHPVEEAPAPKRAPPEAPPPPTEKRPAAEPVHAEKKAHAVHAEKKPHVEEKKPHAVHAEKKTHVEEKKPHAVHAEKKPHVEEKKPHAVPAPTEKKPAAAHAPTPKRPATEDRPGKRPHAEPIIEKRPQPVPRQHDTGPRKPYGQKPKDGPFKPYAGKSKDGPAKPYGNKPKDGPFKPYAGKSKDGPSKPYGNKPKDAPFRPRPPTSKDGGFSRPQRKDKPQR